jgi:hypothetical protein
MNMKTLARALRFAPLLALSLAAGCSDLGLDAGGEVAGLTIQDAGGTLVTVGSTGSVSGGLSVPRNQQRTLTIVLRTAGGGVVTPGLGQSIRVTVTNPGVATWTEIGLGIGQLRGVASGSTTMRVDLIDAGTAVYTSPLITIQAT